MQELLIALRRYRRGLSHLLLLAIFAGVNCIPALASSDFYIFFSPFLPRFFIEAARAFSSALGLRTVLTAGIFVSLCLLSLWFYLRLLTRRSARAFRAATLYYAVDTAVLLLFSLSFSYPVGILDAVLHLLPLLSLFLASRAERVMESFGKRGVTLSEEMLAALVLPPEGLSLGYYLGDDLPDEGDTPPLRLASARARCLASVQLFGMDICVRRAFGVTELAVDGEVLAEQRGLLELAYSLTATRRGHRITLRFAAGRLYGRVLLLVDGRLAADVRRYF